MSTLGETPRPFFDRLDAEFHFNLDVCALPETAKCAKYFTPDIDGLKQDWSGHTFWMNPPYGRGQDVYSWVRKAWETTVYGLATGVCLLPASVDTRWFREFCMKGKEIRVVEDRLWFSLNGGRSQRANHGSLIVVFQTGSCGAPKLSTIPNFRKVRP